MKKSRKKITLFILTILMLGGGLLATVQQPTQSVEAAGGLITKWTLCAFDDGQKLYNYNYTDLAKQKLLSKSAVVSSERVDTVLNKILGLAGFDFVANNEAILGRDLDSVSMPPKTVDEANKIAPKMSVFDRFGLAGMTFSSYVGEWKYYHIDACSSAGSVSNTNYGNFYEGRLEPKSTYDEKATSLDIRTQHFNKGFTSNVVAAVGDIISNALFTVSKFVMAITIALVGISFSDVSTLFGFGVSGAATGSSSVTIFTNMYNSLFSGFVVISFVLTGLNIIYTGLIKKQYKEAIITVGKTILVFMIAVGMSTNPAYWISVPNKVATYGQALVLSGMSGIFEENSTSGNLCSTDVGSIYSNVNIGQSKTESAIMDDFEQVGHNMKSIIGCKMWESFLFRPWISGQFGELQTLETLEDKWMMPVNSDWVGDASVPLGNGKYINNWAVFQLSTQTNAHASIGENGLPVIINGVNSDW